MKEIIKKYIFKLTAPNDKKQLMELSELSWANIYHDTIRDKEWLKNLSLSPYGMAANYSMLYVIVRILSEFKINSILELGLGESSKLINTYLENNSSIIKHDIIENDEEWFNFYSNKITSKSEIHVINLTEIIIKNNKINLYNNLNESISSKYDLYIIDGPRGQNRFSRFDICLLAENFNSDDEFIILMDDSHRTGEQESIQYLLSILEKKNIIYYKKEFHGSKSQTLILTQKYKFVNSF